MNLGRLLLRNLMYHWRGNSTVFLGVVVGTAVLTGALLVGDSLRGSLREQTLGQLGWVDHSLVANRFIRQELAERLSARHVAPVILLQGAMSLEPPGPSVEVKEPRARAGRVMVLGVDARFWAGAAPEGDALWQSDKPQVVLNQSLAGALGAAPGDRITLHLQKVSAVPRESLLGRRGSDEVVAAVDLTVGAVIPDAGLGRFTLTPTPDAPRNAFVPLALLQKELGQAGRVNGLLTEGADSAALQQALRQNLTLDDWGLLVREHLQHGYLSLQSRQLLLEPAAVEAHFAAARQFGLRAAPTLVYLANAIFDGTQQIPYSVVAALDPTQAPPLGPFLPPGVKQLNDDEIILSYWKESPLHPKPGDPITLTYFRPEEGRLPEATATFRFAGFVPLTGAAADPGLTPEFPGITDKLTIRDWNPPFPYEPRRIQKRDEDYWKRYRTTPKAYITLAAGQRLWASRFGRLTSLRLAPLGDDAAPVKAVFQQVLLDHLRPEAGGLVFDAVRERGLEASTGGTDFGGLFLAFSFFLIAAALLLVGLLFRLNLDRRGPEVGVLLAEGFRRRSVRRLLLGEGALLTVLGALAGSGVAVLYAALLLALLRAWWPGALDRSFLRLHVGESHGLSFVIGYVAALIVSVLTILWAVRILGRASPRALLAGETAEGGSQGVPASGRRWSRWLAVVAALAAMALIYSCTRVSDHELQALSFFGSGALLLIAALAGVWAWMRGARHGTLAGHGRAALTLLGIRNAARYPVRSLLTIGLLAAAAFLVVAVQSFHRDPDATGAEGQRRDSGTGGFPFLAESDLPIYQDLNDPHGREELNVAAGVTRLLGDVHVYSFRLRAGDDASCLNLYQPRRPRILGVPHALVERGGFRFQDSVAQTPEDRANPWRLLESSAEDTVPVIGDATTVQWMLKSKLGGTVDVPDERGATVHLHIVGLLAESMFQSQLLLSEANFLKLYPNQEGYNFFLIDASPAQDAVVQQLARTPDLAERGFELVPTAERLAAYFAVENTYLVTFQALGGLGLLLGALGLAVVLVRTIWDRRGELALLRALGYRRAALRWLVFAENSFLLVVGLGVGTVSALLAVAPHLAAGAGQVPVLRLVGLIGVVLAVGLAAGATAVATSLRAPLIPALRRE